jgi:hypothetical protein
MRDPTRDNRQKYICPVCGYPGLHGPHVNRHGNSSFEICPCCGVEYGYHDSLITHEELRRRWIERGMKWLHGAQPPGWDASEQLRAAKLLS